jgi:tetratricopeptide (TPR) repeat protein
LPDDGRPTIGLAMIVRDEAERLPACVASCWEWISHWVICDTGSVDGTQDVIRRELAGIPGTLHEHPWVDFAHNRTRLMELARGTADYLLLLDADWTVSIEPGALDRLDADAYFIRHAGEIEFHNKRLVSGRLPWRYVGATHEYITSDEERSCERLEGVTIRIESVGGGRSGRWERDAELLERELAADPSDARAAFYLAQTYRDLGRERDDRDLLVRARDQYLARATLPGWDEETYCALHQAGVLSDELGDWPLAVGSYVRAGATRAGRLEAAHALASGLRLRGVHESAHLFTRVAAGMEPLPVPRDNLFVEPWIYRWGMLFEYSISCYWVGEYERSIAACDRLLALDELPPAHREQTRRNRSLAIEDLARELADRAMTCV